MIAEIRFYYVGTLTTVLHCVQTVQALYVATKRNLEKLLENIIKPNLLERFNNSSDIADSNYYFASLTLSYRYSFL